MISLSRIAKSLLLESSKVKSYYNTIYKSIEEKNVIMIFYEGDGVEGKGRRVVEPVCLGLTSRGNLALRAWVRDGQSLSDYLGTSKLPGWRLFLLDKMTGVVRTSTPFGYVRPGYNTTGDRGLSKIYINAQFTSPRSQTKPAVQYSPRPSEEEFDDLSY